MITPQQLIEQEAVNNRLYSIYGNHPEGNLPRFRLAYVGNEFINRHGTFRDYYNNTDIFLREVTETRTVKKYEHLHDNQWIVERLVPNVHDDIKGNYIYECLWSFPEGLPISWKAIEFLIAHIYKRVEGQDDVELTLVPKDEKEMQWLADRQLKKEKAFIRNAIDSTVTENSLHFRSGVSYAGIGMPEKFEKTGIEIKLKEKE